MTRTQFLQNAATCDEQDAWTDAMTYAWAWNPTQQDTDNVSCYRTLTSFGRDVTVGYVLH